MLKHVPHLTQFPIRLPFTFSIPWLVGFQWKNSGSDPVQRSPCVLVLLVWLASLIIAVRLKIPLHRLWGYLPFHTSEVNRYCLMLFNLVYYLRRRMMRQLDLFKALWCCNAIIIINLLIVWRIFKYYSVLGGTSCVFIPQEVRAWMSRVWY